jgi:hypothetical protein
LQGRILSTAERYAYSSFCCLFTGAFLPTLGDLVAPGPLRD